MRLDNPMTAVLAALIDRVRGVRPKVGEVGDLSDRTCLITGANSGLGKAVATDLARRGARVIMGCRSGIPEAGEAIKRETGNQRVQMLQVDFSQLASVQRFCDQLRDAGERLDVVVLNAAVMPRHAQLTGDGFELMLQVNYLANVLLLERLLGDGVIANRAFAHAPASGRRPRIVIVSSEAHRTAKPLDIDTFAQYVDYGVLDGTARYGHTKLLLCTLATELSRRLRDPRSVDVSVHALCPGPVDSNLIREAPLWLKPPLRLIMRLFFNSPEVAAQPVVYLAGAGELEGETGWYLHMTTRKEPAPQARDAAIGKQLWEASQKLVHSVERRAANGG